MVLFDRLKLGELSRVYNLGRTVAGFKREGGIGGPSGLATFLVVHCHSHCPTSNGGSLSGDLALTIRGRVHACIGRTDVVGRGSSGGGGVRGTW